MAWIRKQRRMERTTGKKADYWSIQWRNDLGKIRTRGLGFCGKADATRALKVFEGRVASGQPLEPTATATGSSRSKGKTTLGEYLYNVFLPVVKRDRAPKTYETKATSAKNLHRLLGHLPLTAVSYSAVDAYVSERKREGRRTRTIILELLCLRQALTHAVDCGVLEVVPKLPKVKDVDRKPHRFLTVAESKRLLTALRPDPTQKGRTYPVTYLAVLLALNAGLRRNELLTRTWDDILWDRGPHGVLLVRAKPEAGFQVKTRRERAIPLTPELREAFDDEHARCDHPSRGWVFPSPRDATKPRMEFRKALQGACERAKIPQIHPHGLRHTWASRLAMAGVDRKTVMELGGWSEGRMLDEVYAHVTDDHMADVMTRMGI